MTGVASVLFKHRAARRRMIAPSLAAACAALLAAAPGAAGAVGELGFTGCVGPAVGCVATPSAGLKNPESVVASSTGSVYVGTETGVTHLFAGSGLAYDGCVSNDGSGGECAATPGPQELINLVFGLATSPNGAAVYAGAATQGAFGAISRLAAAPQGQLTWKECVSSNGTGGFCEDALGPAPGTPIEDPAHLAVSPDGSSVYSADLNGAVSHFFANPATGEFSFDGCVGGNHKTGNPNCVETPEGVMPNSVGIGVSPLAQVYVLTDADAVVHLRTDAQGRLFYEGCFGRSELAGKCTTFEGLFDPLHHSTDMTVAPNGGIYTVSDDGVLAHFRTDSEGRIAYADCVSAVASEVCSTQGIGAAFDHMQGIAASPDGRNLYVVTGKALLTFGLGANGAPTLEGCISSTVPGCTPLPGVALAQFEDVAVSPDGSAVYTVADEPASVARFSRALPPPGGSQGPGGSQSSGGQSSGAGGPKQLGGTAAGNPVFCDGRRATIVGTAGNDHLRGTPRADVIAGLAGNDTIEGLAGNDYVCGGPGNDRLIGGAGNDHLDGEAGNDKLAGQAGADVLRGGAGGDKLEGGAGNDQLLGQAGQDTLLGGAGNDKLEGGPGKDKLSGGPGHNSLHS